MLAVYVNHCEGGVVWNETKGLNFRTWKTTHEKHENEDTLKIYTCTVYKEMCGYYYL